ncbi:hypothetical protein TcasGA2_TC007378 [Tribolium castaneum]|uniref:Uncharacterized protein n=1 Tax=Tribolium castaneum TaxID=7070 RepID=D1ZZY3_TRICA|nr:hypothetical protein TcasGA2_TC007378 [Tribolium castaneum]
MCKWLWRRSSAKSSYGVRSHGSRKSSVADISGMEEEAKVESPSESYRVMKDN